MNLERFHEIFPLFFFVPSGLEMKADGIKKKRGGAVLAMCAVERQSESVVDL